MVVVKVDLPPAIDKLFREKVLERYGFRRGAISEALIEAIKQWIKQEQIENQSNQKQTDYSDLKIKYSGKYLAIRGNDIIVIADNLEDLWNQLPEDPQENYLLLTPNLPKPRRAQLGWMSKIRK